MEAMPQVEIVPAVSGGNRLIHFDVQGAQLGDVGGALVWVVKGGCRWRSALPGGFA
jgi:hypothetical protein